MNTDWYKFLDPLFAFKKESIRDRDRVVAVCTCCFTTNVVIVNNLKRQVKKLGTHLCWSCSSRKARLKFLGPLCGDCFERQNKPCACIRTDQAIKALNPSKPRFVRVVRSIRQNTA